ncbi:hypothetical protein [Corynebacterium glutamicum]|uniref:hypothetical protein n=1 Tax=Corynebacterium glutamicum TaxID=1718 RepID=UPI001B8AA83F|nr:hypothetical protein [Corynebacterium glutamicum]
MNWTEYVAQLAITIIVPVIAGGFTLWGIARNNKRAKTIRDEDIRLERDKEDRKAQQASFQMQLSHIAEFLSILRDETNAVNHKVLNASENSASGNWETSEKKQIQHAMVNAKVDFYMQVLKACEVLDLYITEPEVYKQFHQFFYLVDNHWHGLQSLLHRDEFEQYVHRMGNELALPEEAISALQELRGTAREQLSLSTPRE